MSLDLDPRFTFDSFVVGPANRLAAAAARKVAESPGVVYNPLLIYSGSGLGKTHLLGAIGRRAEELHSLTWTYESAARLMEVLSEAVGAGDRNALRNRLRGVSLLLLDDVQFVAGQRQAQEELLRVWDALTARGAQVVLTSDRPPPEIDALDDRLLSRLSGGLLVDIGPPDFETRVVIARRKARDRGVSLSGDIYRALARVAFTNVRELQGALNRLIAVKELEDREITPEEVPFLLGTAAERGLDEFGEFLADVAGTMDAVVEKADQRVADAVVKWESEGFRTARLDDALGEPLTSAQADRLIEGFEGDVDRLIEIQDEIRALDPDVAELGSEVLRDPDRVPRAEALLAAVRERAGSPPPPPPGPTLDEIGGAETIAMRAARAVLDSPGRAYNPFYLLGPRTAGGGLLLALANGFVERGRTVAYIDGRAFAEELIGALDRGRMDGWRARYRRSEVLILTGLEGLEGLERGHDELFHLFEELHGAARQLVFSAGVPPQQLPVPSRLRSRLEAGLVVELTDADAELAGAVSQRAPGSHGPQGPPESASSSRSSASTGSGGLSGDRAPHGSRAPSPPGSDGSRSAGWLLDPERLLWEWPYDEDWIHVEEG